MTAPASQRLADAASRFLERRLSRRGMLARLAVVGSAVTTGGVDYLLHPGTAYASVCGSGHTCSSGWTAMCCTIHQGVNQCPPGSFAGGWWKAEGASLCGGKARYYVDCQAECTGCGCRGSHFCHERCWDCKPHCAHGSCDERRVCHNVFRYGQCERGKSCSGPVLCRAISCTPPWKWANCSSASATDEFTVSHTAPCLPRWSPIQKRYTELGAQGSPLGATVGHEQKHKHGHLQRFEHGRMYWSHATGAHYLTGRLLHHYRHIGELASPLGLPVRDERDTLDGHGRSARFQHGGIYDGPHTGAHALWGAVWHHWRDLKGVLGPLGYPTADLDRTRDHHGHVGRFTGGAIYQHGGKAPCAILAGLEAKYRERGGETGVLGYPIDDEGPVSDSGGIAGVQVVCQHGAITQAGNAVARAVWGPIFGAWQSLGGVAGQLGYPLSDVTDVTLSDGPGQECLFEHGTVTYDETTGQVTVTPG